MIIGNTHDETRAFLRDPSYEHLEWADLPALLVPNMRVDIEPGFVIKEYRRIYPDNSPTQVFFAATTAARSWRGAIIELEERAKQDGADTFAYHLDWQSPVNPKLGAPHAADIALIFGNLDAAGSISGPATRSACGACRSAGSGIRSRTAQWRGLVRPPWRRSASVVQCCGAQVSRAGCSVGDACSGFFDAVGAVSKQQTPRRASAHD
jgi:para-nitrobenzyl esterase